MTTLEKAARALGEVKPVYARLALSREGYYLWRGGGPYPPLDFDTPPPGLIPTHQEADDQAMRINRELIVRAVLEAIRDPDDGMIAAGWKPNDFNSLTDSLPKATWQAMIDQILKAGA